jgi:chromosome partitioning protein
MKTILILSNKGGVGCTTAAFNTAIFAARRHDVVAIDMDPAQAFTMCANRREVRSDRLVLLEGASSVTAAIEKLVATGNKPDYLIVDAPKMFVSKMREAIAVADCIVLPVTPSPLDVLVNEEVVRMVRELGKINEALFLVNGVDGRSSIGRETLDLLAAKSPHRPAKLTERVDYRRSLIAGLAAFEVNEIAEVEISTLWDAIRHVLSRREHVHQTTEHAGPEAGSNGQGPANG